MANINTPLKDIPKITPKYARILEKLGLFTVEDLLLYFPFRYDDFSRITEISHDYLEKTITVEGRVTKTKNRRIFPRRMTVTEAVIQDRNNTPLKVVWFNQPFILQTVREGVAIRCSGKLSTDGKFLTMVSPVWERADREATNTGRLVPVYSETVGITSKWIRWQIQTLLPISRQLDDIIPGPIREKFHLYDIATAIKEIHFPANQERLIRAQKRFAFEEMFLVQLKSLQVKKQWEGNKGVDIKFDEKLIKDFVEKLPFQLTDAQRKSTFEILKDLGKPKPMNRLLEGDVGSGKTVVAAMAALQVVKGSGTFFAAKKVPDPLRVAGYQVAIMAPTEVLARQHFMSFSELFKGYDINIALLTNSYREINNFEVRSSPGEINSNFQNSNFKIDSKFKIQNSKLTSGNNKQNTRNKLLDEVRSGKVNLIIGTHALIQKDVKFKSLALVIIDEQHRFGVAQRATLQQETMDISDGNTKIIPHLLTMTATPIPRTLAIAFFGSLDLSILDEMPKNRKPIITKIITPSEKEKTYQFVKHEINSGRQAFIIFPLIEESKALSEVKAATAEHERLSKDVFPEFKLGLMHGKLKPKEKEEVMTKFKNKEYDILVSTSVVEVGIDVPNSTVMIIENAERFGLSQLHQFRGRVGRGEHQSYCFLFTEKSDRKRLQAMEKTNDGFEISKIDLELRGPGQFFGTIQSGLPDIAMENLTNVKLIKFAREEAQNILKEDPQLKKHPLLTDALKKFSEKIHLE